MSTPPRFGRRLLAPEIVQISTMDCGPAALKCFLEGADIGVSFGRLREVCQTSVDGTSIDTLEEIALQLGLDVEQRVVPLDHVLLPESCRLPAIAVVRRPGGLPHFVVIWSRYGDLVQIMDPAVGRRWVRLRAFRDELYLHSMSVPAADWRVLAAERSFLGPLEWRLTRLGIPAAVRLSAAQKDPRLHELARLDAAVRMVAAIVAAQGIRRGREATRVLDAVVASSRRDPPEAPPEAWSIPEMFWAARTARSTDPGGEAPDRVLIRGAVLLYMMGPARTASPSARTVIPPDELATALGEAPLRPLPIMLRLLRADGFAVPGALLGGLALTALGVVLAVVLFRTLVEIGQRFRPPEQRLSAMIALVVFIAILLLLELPLGGMMQWLGRHLELRLRIAFLKKLPRLDTSYLQSRPTSDMAERCHSVHRVRMLPFVGGQLVRFVLEIVLTVAGIIWVDPRSAPIASAVALLSIALPVLVQAPLIERDLRVRSHAGALSRFYLDVLVGLQAVRMHGAERAVRREHEVRLVDWVRAGCDLLRASVAIDTLNTLVSFAFATWLFTDHLSRSQDTPGALILLFWALNLPAVGQEVAQLIKQYPAHRNTVLRLVEPLGALEAPRAVGGAAPDALLNPVSIRLEGVAVLAGGRTILEDLNLSIAPGEHVAIVGPSGAGKSSLVGLLLGWHRAAAGTISVDGMVLDGALIESLRRSTVWVDPAVQLWNRPLLENLTYGSGEERDVGQVIQNLGLRQMIENLPEGLQSPLGEGGGLVSGGEGQRIRLARAFSASTAGLVILDEPFRGLDRDQRRVLLADVQRRFRGVTMLCITHDLAETQTFDRVLVVEGGRLVEDGVPIQLQSAAGSRYRALLDAEHELRERLWSSASWRRVHLGAGVLHEEEPPP